MQDKRQVSRAGPEKELASLPRAVGLAGLPRAVRNNFVDLTREDLPPKDIVDLTREDLPREDLPPKDIVDLTQEDFEVMGSDLPEQASESFDGVDLAIIEALAPEPEAEQDVSVDVRPVQDK